MAPRALEGGSKGTQRALGHLRHSKGTRRALGYLKGTKKELGHSKGTWVLEHFRE